jgi:hypothetical protein
VTGLGCLSSLTNILPRADDVQFSSPQETQDELMNLMTIMYIVIQTALNDPDDMSMAYGKLRTLE